MLAAEGLRVRLGEVDVLRGVTLALAAGQVTAVVGPNGAGKSTLLACLAGLRRPQSGAVRLGEAALAGLAPRERARRIGFLEQSPEIAWDLDVRTLVGLGRTPWLGARGLAKADQEIVGQAMARAHVEGLAERLVGSLSGGERGRVLIARVLAGEPDWLLADEPMAGLDPAHQIDAAALFRRLADEGHGVVVTLHDLTLAARMADRVVVLAGGRILADGSPLTALDPRVLAEAYGVEARLSEGLGGLLVEVAGRLG
jgi:iron complex transport system ATP-binding protein